MSSTRNGRRIDVVLGENPDLPGTPLAHRPDCAYVQGQRLRGEPLLALVDCAHDLPDSLARHDCLLDERGELTV